MVFAEVINDPDDYGASGNRVPGELPPDVEDLYGECSFEVQQVIKAWDAVGISIPSLKYCGNLVGNNFRRSFAAIVFAPNNCPTTIKNGSNMRYQSHSYIELLSGFEVEAGASFEADTYECN